MKQRIPALATAILAAVLVFGIVYLAVSYQLLGHKRYEARLQVGEKLGFNVDTNAIDFGTGQPGNVLVRSVVITNSYIEPAQVSVVIDGPIEPLVSPLENNQIVQPGQIIVVDLEARIPEKPDQNEYHGTIHFYFFRLFGQ